MLDPGLRQPRNVGRGAALLENRRPRIRVVVGENAWDRKGDCIQMSDVTNRSIQAQLFTTSPSRRSTRRCRDTTSL